MNKLSIEEIQERLDEYGYKYVESFDNKRKIICETQDGYKLVIDYTGIKEKDKILFQPYNPYIIDNLKNYIKLNKLRSELLSTKYINNSSDLLFMCECGKQYTRPWAAFYKGYGLCKECSIQIRAKQRIKHTYSDVENILNNKNYELIYDGELNAQVKETDMINFICNIHQDIGIQNATLGTIINRNNNCIKCNCTISGLKRRVPETELKKRTEAKGLIYKGVQYNLQRSRILYICPNHIEKGIQSTTYTSIAKENYRCPYCARESRASFLQQKVYNYLTEKNYTVKTENDCSILPYNPETNRPLPYDNEVVELKLIIEVNGEQHYRSNTSIAKMQSVKYGITQEEVLKKQQKHDEFKKQYAIKHGYNYLIIPYWTENDESYKAIIDNKIKEIIS